MNNIDKGNNMTKQTSTAIEQEIAIKFGNYGWICPVCGRGNSPYTSICPCKPLMSDITCSPGKPSNKYIFTTSTTGGTINEAR